MAINFFNNLQVNKGYIEIDDGGTVNQRGIISYGVNGKIGATTSWTPDTLNNPGLWVEGSNDGESGGIFMNGNTFALWSPGDQGILKIYDEDNFSQGPIYQITGSGISEGQRFASISNSAYYLDPDGDSQLNTLDIDDYVRHRSDTNTYIGFPANDTFTVTTFSSERMRIDSSGNVGIGTTSPNTALEVDGAISTTTSDYVQGSTGSRLLLETSGSGNTHSYIQAQNTGGTSNAEDLAFQLYGGNVGIGTTTANERLVVSGNANITNNLYVGYSNSLLSCTYPAAQSLIVGRNNSLGGVDGAIIGYNNSIACTQEPWLNFGGNFIAGITNNIVGGYSHANAVFGQLNEVGTSSINVSNALIGGSEHEVTSANVLMFGRQCRAFNSTYSLTGGFDSNNFGGFGSVAIGAGATASLGNNQYAFGTGVTTPTTASAAYGADQFVVGKFNEYTNSSFVSHRFAVGNGSSDFSRDTPFCIIGSGTYTNGQVSINDSDGFAYSSAPYSILHVNGRATSSYSSAFTVTSDERVKKNIADYNKGLVEILQVQPKSYSFNGKANTIEGVESIGVLAQEIKEVFPETVGTANKKLNPEDEQETELYTVDISPVTYALINAVKELNAKVEALETRIQTLEGN